MLGNQDRLIKIVLKGLYGPLEVQGIKYTGQVPMTPFGGMLKDDEVAAVVTYVRNSFGNKASPVSPAKVKQVRAATKCKTGFYSPEELLKQHPIRRTGLFKVLKSLNEPYEMKFNKNISASILLCILLQSVYLLCTIKPNSAVQKTINCICYRRPRV